MRRNDQTVGMPLMESPAQCWVCTPDPGLGTQGGESKSWGCRGKGEGWKGPGTRPHARAPALFMAAATLGHPIPQAVFPHLPGWKPGSKVLIPFPPTPDSQSSQILPGLSFPMCGCVDPIVSLTSFPHLKHCTGDAEPWKAQRLGWFSCTFPAPVKN